MQNLLEELIQLLSEDERLVSEGKLLKNKVIELALNMDAGLIKLLLKNESIKRHFFAEIGGVLVFDKIKFQRFVSNKQFLPDSYTTFKNKIGLVNENGDYLSESREVALAWPYKDCVLEGGQTKEDQKRDEIFWNETLAPDEIDRLLAPKVFTSFKQYDKDGEYDLSGNEKIDFSKENLIVKGNNLLALHSLYKRFAGQVKLIYIDPPYNTGSDSFKYNDSFNHSTWLTFMKNRLEVARGLLSKEGSIFIQIDDNEQAYTKVLCDEVFGRDNFKAQISWLRSSSGKTVSRNLPSDVDYLIWYSKSESYDFFPVYTALSPTTIAMYNKDDKDSRGKYRLYPLQKTGGPGPETTYDYKDNKGKIWKCPAKGWRMKFGKLKALENDGRLYIDGKTIAEKAYWNERENEGRLANNLWDDIYNLQGSNSEKIDFTGQKPENLIKRVVELVTKESEIVLDFHLGSGTTCAVAHKMGRQYIGIEQLDYQENDSVVRLKNVINGDQSGISKAVNYNGGGSFIYCELMEYNETYINRIRKAKTTKELLAVWEEMQEKAFLSYKVDPKTINANISEFESLSLDEQRRFLIEALDKNQLYVNYSEIDDEDYGVTDTDKKLNRRFYWEA
ncbi:MAG: site-specific DNA-methyltransferase [Nitrospinae bacterium]|nr:site-specific DNA-methyltransferase [Nitrospinota bacterium]